MSHGFDWPPKQTFEPRRYQPGRIGNWSGHLPFAHDLVVAARPSLLVELGTHLGESYFGFCQTIAENNLSCLAYAVDTWEGEPHSGFYDQRVYEDVDSYNKANYSHFSYLLKTLFDEARKNFSDDSIDLLHIDGLHTFEAVYHDFNNWLPKVKPGGIVLLHDIAVRHLDFGVWEVWEQLKSQGETFDFAHSWGLGVFRKPRGSELQSEFLSALFKSDEATHERIRRYYHLASLELEAKHQLKGINPTEQPLSFQVYFPSSNGYTEVLSQREIVQSNTWNCLQFDMAEGITTGLLRLDPVDVPAVIDLRGISFRSAVDHLSVWNISGPELDALTCGGTAVSVPGAGENGARRFFSYGVDPQIYLPPLDVRKFDQPLILEVWVRIQTNLSDLVPWFQDPPQPAPLQLQQPEPETSPEEVQILRNQLAELLPQKDELESVVHSLTEKFATLSEQQAAFQAEQDKTKQELNRRQTRILFLEGLHDLTQQTQKQLEKTESKLRALEPLHTALEQDCAYLRSERDRLQSTLDGVLRSSSWRITSLMRRLTEKLRSR